MNDNLLEMIRKGKHDSGRDCFQMISLGILFSGIAFQQISILCGAIVAAVFFSLAIGCSYFWIKFRKYEQELLALSRTNNEAGS